VATEAARHVIGRDLHDTPELLERIRFAATPIDAVAAADALVIMTEWKVYRSLNLAALKTSMKAPVIFDGRNLYEPDDLRTAGFDYFTIGRSTGAGRH
jgi:UDPglucose 6-dehydrogenase